MAYQSLALTKEEGVATITLQRPESLNALNRELAQELLAALGDCAQDQGVRAVVLKAAGRAFCAGGDIKAMQASLGQDAAAFFRELVGMFHQAVMALREMPKPVLASVHGFASGGGFSLALACDLRMAADTARFNMAYVNIAVTPDGGGSFFLPRLAGLGKAMQLVFTGEVIDAREAERLGLVNWVVPEGELEAKTQEVARRLARSSPGALAEAKRLLNLSLGRDMAAQLEDERETMARRSATEDFREGIAAFLAKRPPQFPGR